jgi:Lrp/AsnC family transcriptional regulator, regulator for asnA, asnC and gidA
VMKIKLDDIDTSILELLKKDARTSFREIARKTGVAADTIIKRFERLKEQGVIVNSTLVLNPKKIGYSFISRFGIDVKPAYSTQVLGEVIKIPSVIVASKLVGKYDLISIIVIKDFNHLCEIRDLILEMPYVEKVETSMWINTMELCPYYFLI